MKKDTVPVPCRSGVFEESPLKSRAVHGATICDVILPINTQYGAKSRHSRENGNLEALVPIGFEFMKHALQTSLRPSLGTPPRVTGGLKAGSLHKRQQQAIEP